jgi:phosphonopyruvate decarboxylase
MAIDSIELLKFLRINDIEFYTGVADSLLKNLIYCIDKNVSQKKHIVAANEGNAIAIAAGYHLATKKIPVVYMQNSGLGNAINPLLSLCDREVYSIPMILMIGWRGKPGFKDEPQHIKQGRIQLALLKSLEIPFEIINRDKTDYKKKIQEIINKSKNTASPTALLFEKGSFEEYNNKINDKSSEDKMFREEALKIILKETRSEIIVSTTGKTSREIFEIREKRKESHEQDFLTVGSMGHCSSIALGIAIEKPNEKIVCIDGDGAMIMHLGAVTSISSLKPSNYYHILINNQAHESVGGQKTAAKDVSLLSIVKSSGYKNVFSTSSSNELKKIAQDFLKSEGPAFLEVIIKTGSRENLGRPKNNPIQNKNLFLEYLKSK